MTASELKYILTIYYESGNSGFIKSARISDKLCISRAGVSKASERLLNKKLIEKDSHKMLKLSDTGVETAELYIKAISVIERALTERGVKQSLAKKEAVSAAAVLCTDTVKKISSF